MDKEKLHRYALNKITDQSEIEEIVSWIESSVENKKEFNEIKNLWAYTNFADYNSYAKIPDENLQKMSKRKIIDLHFGLLKYVAVLILSFLVGGTVMFFIGNGSDVDLAYNEVIVPYGESAEVILPDKTHVWLNSGSHLIYPSSFKNNTRQVQLKGEALFEVNHDPAKPFHVLTRKLTVEVLGTTFNVEAFSNTENVKVTLIEGKVNIQNISGKVLAGLEPNQRASYNEKTGSVDIDQVDSDFYSSWKKGVYRYKDEKLVDITQRLERLYNVEVVFDDNIAIKNIKYSGTILRNKPIEQILDVFKFTSAIDYHIEMNSLGPNVVHLKMKQP